MGTIGICYDLAEINFPQIEPWVKPLVESDAVAPDASTSATQSRFEFAQWILCFPDVAVSVCLFVVGVGLLRMRPWARKLGLITAASVVLLNLASAVLVYLAWTRSQRPDGQDAEALIDWSVDWLVDVLGNVLRIGVCLLGIAYGIAALVILLRPSVAAAFRPQKSEPEA
jgi:hypothetical protein